jgi:hypothetical protein
MSADSTTVYREIGTMLCQLQTLEEVMSFCLTALRCEPAITFEQITLLDEEHRKATLGRLVRLIPKSIEIEEDFARTIDRFISTRNLFVHHRFIHADFNPELSARACANALQFIEALRADYIIVKGVFARYILEIGSQFDEEVAELLAKLPLDEIYGPMHNPLNVEFKKA